MRGLRPGDDGDDPPVAWSANDCSQIISQAARSLPFLLHMFGGRAAGLDWEGVPIITIVTVIPHLCIPSFPSSFSIHHHVTFVNPYLP